jgi:ribosomal protein L16 Arg81 hydroxylase
MPEVRTLSELLAPFQKEIFLRDYWLPQRPLYIPGWRDKLSGLLTRESFLAALHDVPPNRSIHLKVSHTDAHGASTEYGCMDAAEALRHFARGATICATALDLAQPRLEELRRALEEEFLTPDAILFNCYYSPDGQGFGTHFDQQSVWVLQIEGMKRWRYSPGPAVPYPTENTTAGAAERYRTPDGSRISKPDESTFCDVLLKPGDILYLPAGTWHRGMAAGGESLALSLTQPHNGFASMMFRLLKKHLFRESAWRQHALTPAAWSLDEIQQFFSARLRELAAVVNRLGEKDVCDHWYGEISKYVRPADPPAYTSAVTEPVTPLLYFTNRDDGNVVLYHGASRYTLPIAAKLLLDLVKRGEELTTDAACAVIAPEGEGRELVDDLVQIGVLRLAST